MSGCQQSTGSMDMTSTDFDSDGAFENFLPTILPLDPSSPAVHTSIPPPGAGVAYASSYHGSNAASGGDTRIRSDPFNQLFGTDCTNSDGGSSGIASVSTESRDRQQLTYLLTALRDLGQNLVTTMDKALSIQQQPYNDHPSLLADMSACGINQSSAKPSAAATHMQLSHTPLTALPPLLLNMPPTAPSISMPHPASVQLPPMFTAGPRVGQSPMAATCQPVPLIAACEDHADLTMPDFSKILEPFEHSSSAVRLLNIKRIAREMTTATFGEDVLRHSTVSGKNGKGKLDPRKLNYIKKVIRNKICKQETEEDFEELWREIILTSIAHSCKYKSRKIK